MRAEGLFIVVAFLLCVKTSAEAQVLPRVPGEFLIQAPTAHGATRLAEQWLLDHPEIGLDTVFLCAEMLDVWLFRLSSKTPADSKVFTKWTADREEVTLVQPNLLLQQRSGPLPNDALFGQQWHLKNTGQNGGLPGADLGAEAAWAISTGGDTPLGDEVVVAVIDGGVNRQHEDLLPNMWVNDDEIPGDSVDNDQNGYVDDYLGWNVFAENDNIAGTSSSHGTAVTGVLGARGNNNRGISGIAWDIDVMFVAGTGNTAALLQSYDYVWKARKRYNETNGAKGAYVVAVNCSWGINFAFPDEAPLWCAVFDVLGEQGILSIAPVANVAVDIDVNGDLPGTCLSPFLITTTSLDRHDDFVANAAWGRQSVDLGAYGSQIMSTHFEGGYHISSGTSLAAPQVAGAIGLLYSAPCPLLAEQALLHPAFAALWVKAQILRSATDVAALQDITQSEGRLHAGQLLQRYQTFCDSCPEPISAQVTQLGSSAAVISTPELPIQAYFSLRWRKGGTSQWTTLDSVSLPVSLSGLSACTKYEYQLRANCTGGQISSWTPTCSFKTDGCCNSPVAIQFETHADSVMLHWKPVTAANGYMVYWKLQGSTTWSEAWVQDTFWVFSDAQPCTSYAFSVRSVCDTGLSAWADEAVFTTPGCGPCIDHTYCEAHGLNSGNDWIESIQIGEWLHQSGQGPGYALYEGAVQAGVPVFYAHELYPLTIDPGYIGAFLPHFFRIYIDYSGDGDFDDPGELAFDPGFALDGPAEGWLQFPEVDSFDRNLRMRVMMKLKGPIDTAPAPCESFGFGQVLDYCVRIAGGATSVQKQSADSLLSVYPNPAGSRGVWVETEELTSDGILRVSDISGNSLYEMVVQAGASRWLIPTGNLPAGVYTLSFVQPDNIKTERLVITK